MNAARSLLSVLSAASLASALAATSAFAQAPPPVPPVLAADGRNDSCGWGLGGAAAGLGVAALTAPKAATPVNWSGLYFGGHLGCAWADSTWSFNNTSAFSNAGGRTTFDNSGMIAGGQIGYNLQAGNWVFGVEASLSGGDFADSKVNALNPNPAVNSTKFGADMRWLLQVTPRIGYVFAPAWHGYVKGGFASAEIDTNMFISNGAATSSAVSNSRHSGWTIGTGLEYMLAQNLILGIDYSFIRLDADTRTAFCNTPCGVNPVLKVDPGDIHMLTGRISFKLGGEAPQQQRAPLK